MTMKNISAFALNVSAEELMERFKRGDEARTSQGSGLGLSIARSLIEIQSGSFQVDIDGDLFKVTLRLKSLS
jgi:signal transduction histidine kinase